MTVSQSSRLLPVLWLILVILVLAAILFYNRAPIMSWFQNLTTPHADIGGPALTDATTELADHDRRITALETETGDLKGRVNELESAPSSPVAVQQDPKVCTVPGSVYVDILLRCVHS